MKYKTGWAPLFFTAAGLIITLVLVCGCAGSPAGERGERKVIITEADAAKHVYEGTGQGYRGIIRVRLSVEAGTISEITVTDSAEDRAVGGAAIEELLDMVLLYNTADLDAISGATETSRGFLSAVENALKAR